MATKIHVFGDTQEIIRGVSKDIQSAFGEPVSDRCMKAIEGLYLVEGDFDSVGSGMMMQDVHSGFPYGEVRSVIELAPRIVRAKGVGEFEKFIDVVHQALQEGQMIVDDDTIDHHGMSTGTIHVLTYSGEACKKIENYTDRMTDEIRKAICNAGLELGVEINKDKASYVIDEIRMTHDEKTARGSDFPDMDVVLIIEGKVRVPIDNVRCYTVGPKRFQMWRNIGSLNQVAPQWPETKKVSGFICRGIDNRCYGDCKYNTGHK